MKDEEIIELYWQRNESAIEETNAKYGAYCGSIALNLLLNMQDSEECVNDTWLAAWNKMPPARPEKLALWLGCIVRRIAINMWNKNHARKRYAGVETLLSELEDCIPATGGDPYFAVEEKELTDAINRWLSKLSKGDRILFVRRYWHGESVSQLAQERCMAPTKLSGKLFRLRKKLRTHLEKEGITL